MLTVFTMVSVPGFNAKDGTPIGINPDHVAYVTVSSVNDASFIHMRSSKEFFVVKGSVEDVVKRLNGEVAEAPES